MCQRVTCNSCGKPTYAGCGRHIEQVLGDVPSEERCVCREQKQAKPTQPKNSWIKQLFAALGPGL
jgi:hypothetical protein